MTKGVPCPGCGSSSSLVTNSRPVLAKNATKRRRECDDCRERFTTWETLTEPADVVHPAA